MNQNQKLATLILRLLGTWIAFRGIAGPLYAVLAKLSVGANLPLAEKWVASLEWTVGGMVLILASKRIGKLLARDLD